KSDFGVAGRVELVIALCELGIGAFYAIVVVPVLLIDVELDVPQLGARAVGGFLHLLRNEFDVRQTVSALSPLVVNRHGLGVERDGSGDGATLALAGGLLHAE